MPRYPHFDIEKVETLRDALYERIRGRAGHSLAVEGFVQSILELLPGGATYGTVFESISYLIIRPPTDRELWELSWRLAGNLPALRKGIPVRPWCNRESNGWMPLQIVRAVRTVCPYPPGTGKIRWDGYRYWFRVLAGPACPELLSWVWPHHVTRAVARKLGYTAPFRKYPFTSGAQLVLLRFLGEVGGAEDARNLYPVVCPPAMLKWNRDNVIRRRLHIDPCPNGWTHPCQKCAVGYLECPGAVHRHTYEYRRCPVCGNERAVFDPERPDKLDCWHCAKAPPDIAAGRRSRQCGE